MTNERALGYSRRIAIGFGVFLAIIEVFYNWEHESRAEFTLSRVGGEGRAPDAPTEAQMAERILKKFNLGEAQRKLAEQL